ncbi:DUF2851 family protein [Cellulophaga sp. E16_2]|uniref:DUF2851 family protein n=1 Tax=Cellulophaga sp. E16_2 TaxID=2789297 RepID=UPI001A912729|nr:DUF2851 family protein [Cellulophaga sp. E16_2]MBO0592106.1 DUF2851 family protein [Cellulophaga sp. E16_2]
MREDFLHFIWKHKKIPTANLISTTNEAIEIVKVGTHNYFAGPDFFNSQIRIGNQLWAGNVEIHIKASDWYAHNHELDANYANVILHVVWEEDTAIYRKDNIPIPTLELKTYLPEELVLSYEKLFSKSGKSFINCEKQIEDVAAFTLRNWLDRLYFERLEDKSKLILKLLEDSKNNWEEVLFVMLLKNFGLKINGDAFLSLAQHVNIAVIRKIGGNTMQLESLLFGLSGLLDESNDDIFFKELKKEYQYVKLKFQCTGDGVLKPAFFKLRPPNFPTIRLSQFSNLYSGQHNLFSKLIEATTLEEMYSIFSVDASVYWDTHYTFGKESKKSKKKLTKKFIDLLIINTVLPLKFCYAHHHGKPIDEVLIAIISDIKKEENTIIHKFDALKVSVSNAMESQSILQLYNEYCTKNKCLQCAVGNRLLKGND